MRKHLSTLLKLGVTLLGLAIVLTQFDAAAIGAALAEARPFWLVVGFFFVNASLVLRAFRWLLLVRGLHVNVRFRRLVELYFVGNFFNAFLPSGFGGDIVRILEVAREVPAGVATGTVLVDRLTGLMMLFFLALLALPFRPTDFPAQFLAIIVAVCVAGLVGGFLLLDGRVLQRFGRWLPGALSVEGDGFVAQVVRAVAECGWRAIGGAMFISILFNLLQVAWWTTTGWALGYAIPYSYYLLVVPLLSIALLLPSIGGLGVRELLAPLLFASAGLSSEQAIALTLLVFALERLSGLLGGPIYLFTILRDRDRHNSPRETAETT